MSSLSQILVKDPDILGGTPVFRGTRVPLQNLFDYLEGGERWTNFSTVFPRSLALLPSPLCSTPRHCSSATSDENAPIHFFP